MPSHNNTHTSDKLFDTSDIVVLGGGITGLTTAIVLQSLGLSVKIVSQELPRPGAGEAPLDPHVASSYAMATAYPHNLKVANLEQISDDSQAVFGFLHANLNSGIEIQELYEVFEDEPEPPALGLRRMGIEYFDGKPNQLKDTIDPPARPEADYLWGWRFDTYFANMPKYLSFLWSLFDKRDGILQTQSVRADSDNLLHELSARNSLKQAAGRLLINCMGFGARAFANDRADFKILRGKQLFVVGAPYVIGRRALPLAYNYTPKEKVFPRGDGTPEYMHFFARADGWLLGQTREPGTIDKNGNWQGIVSPVETVDINGVDIPLPFIELNQALISNWLDMSFDRNQLIARQGYRFYRDPLASGVRLELEEKFGACIIHNYGHGGSGITMSWGCALQVARLVSRHLKTRVLPPASDLDRLLQNCIYLH